ncbi:MAG: DUF2163 domain-containing protein [Alphaproteobacteria bacterium]|nr:DUF2163 domain-containing protein [Alphaproteobacteria bacterium]MBN9592501.1 DUF2163 domain-containing protein [Alphaproteobacteria bacterium]
MKTLVPSLAAHLQSGATTLCWCWKITRNDGVVQGFTDHDRPLAFDGVTYEAESGFTASAVQSSLGLSVSNLSVSGALSSESLNAADLAAGLYDNAVIEIWRVNWADTEARVLMRKGNLGEVVRSHSAFQAEMRGLAHVLNQPVGRAFGYSCDADLGDARCGVDLSAPQFTGHGVIASVADDRRFTVSGVETYSDGWFTGGKLTFASGANAPSAMEVKRHGVSALGISIELWQAMSAPVGVGDAFTVTAGCDKQFATCKAKFDNALQFRGFPYMPGNDAVTAYPTQNQTLDGGSRYGN